MVHVYFHMGGLTENQFQSSLISLPLFIQQEICARKKRTDAEKSLIGNLLLQKALSGSGLSSDLSNRKRSDQGKPFLDPPVSFSISHSGDYTVCALSTTSRVGIDIEKIRALQLSELSDYFSPSDWKHIVQSEQPQKELFYLWTRKEALLKAMGVGLSRLMDSLSVTADSVVWENSQWFFHSLSLHKLYPCHVCMENALLPVVVEEVRL